MSKVIGVIQVPFTEAHLDGILAVLNEYRDEEEGELPITKEQVLGDEALLAYIMKEWEKGADHDPFEIWNGDGWADIDQYL